MKPAVHFLLFLCFCFLGMKGVANAGWPHFTASHLQPVEKNTQATNVVTDAEYKTAVPASGGEDIDRILAVDDDDEDQDLVRKHAPPVKQCAVFFALCTLLSSNDCLLTSPPFYKHVSFTGDRKFIAQRVLRI